MTERQAGFSLIEVLAAVSVFALISAISVGMLATGLRTQEQAQAAMSDLASIQRINALLHDDVGQIVMRSVRGEDGLFDPRVFALDVAGADPLNPARRDEAREVLVLTRTGWANPGGLQPRSGLQRVAWIYDGNRLWRQASTYPDLAVGAQPHRQLIAEGVTDLEIAAVMAGPWTEVVQLQSGFGGDVASSGPRAVRFRYHHHRYGMMEHITMSPVAELSR